MRGNTLVMVQIKIEYMKIEWIILKLYQDKIAKGVSIRVIEIKSRRNMD